MCTLCGLQHQHIDMCTIIIICRLNLGWVLALENSGKRFSRKTGPLDGTHRTHCQLSQPQDCRLTVQMTYHTKNRTDRQITLFPACSTQVQQSSGNLPQTVVTKSVGRSWQTTLAACVLLHFGMYNRHLSSSLPEAVLSRIKRTQSPASIA